MKNIFHPTIWFLDETAKRLNVKRKRWRKYDSRNKIFCSTCTRIQDWESDIEDGLVSLIKNTKVSICCVYLPGYRKVSMLQFFLQ